MKQKFRRFMAGFLAVLTMFTTLFSNGTTAFAASPSANIAFWNASVKNTGEVSELKAGYNHGKILYSMIDGNAAYCMNFGLAADGGQLMNSYDNPSTSLSAAQENSLHTVCTLDMDVTQLQHQAMISATSILQHRQWYGRLWQIFLEQVPMILQLISYVHPHLIRPILTLTIQRLRTISVHPIMLQDQVSQAQPRVEQPLMN